ncbi:MAG: AraC family transcriptional regulator [Telmatospirillum sp.]|nr:AraC family transcriptional regulator [Telmatospirillum sp.]
MDRTRTPDDCHAAPRPVAALAEDYPAAGLIPDHRHDRAQLIHAVRGVMTVTAPDARWVVPAGRAVWMPAGTPHSISLGGDVAMRTVYIDPEARAGLPMRCLAIDVPPLLREAIVAATAIALDYEEGGRDERVMELILDELMAAPRLALDVPMPRDPRLLALCERLIADPAGRATLTDLARDLPMSARTLARLFHRELGMSFGEWRRRMRLLLCLPRLAAGAPVLEVALDHGYDSPSAFAAMFRRTLGSPPPAYYNEAFRFPKR